MSIFELNSPVNCDNVVLTIFAGCNEKNYVTFNMDIEELENSIKKYFKRQGNNTEENENNLLNNSNKKLLKTSSDNL